MTLNDIGGPKHIGLLHVFLFRSYLGKSERR